MPSHWLPRILLILGWFAAGLCEPASAASCKALAQQANEEGVRIPGSAAIHRVSGQGRLQFYTAPRQDCTLKGTFILPGERVTAYSTFGDFTSVMYMNPRTGNDAEGWVLSTRLQATGYGIAPAQ